MSDLSIPEFLVESDANETEDQAGLDSKLNELKALELQTAVVTVYVVEISKVNKNLRCKKAKILQCDPALSDQFRGYVIENIQNVDHITAFTEIRTNQDNRVFHITSGQTDFPQIVETLHPGEEEEDLKQVSSLSELQKYNAYVIELYLGPTSQTIYGFRYISQSWSPKNSSRGFLKFTNDMVASYDDSPIFKIDSHLDFIARGNDIFVIDSTKFEVAMQFKQRLIERKADTVRELKESAIFTDGSESVLSSVIATDRHFLRQLASVQTKAFYKNAIWIAELKAVAQTAGNWLLEFDESGKIIVKSDKAYVREILTVLQNKRVQTVIDKKICDVDGELTAQVTR